MARRRKREQGRVTLPKLAAPFEAHAEFITPLGIVLVNLSRMRQRLAEFKSEVERILVSDDGS